MLPFCLFALSLCLTHDDRSQNPHPSLQAVLTVAKTWPDAQVLGQHLHPLLSVDHRAEIRTQMQVKPFPEAPVLQVQL